MGAGDGIVSAERLKRLVNERHAIYVRLSEASNDAGRLVNQINLLVLAAETNRSLGAQIRAKQEMETKIKLVEKARAKKDKLEKDLNRKDAEIADVVAALWGVVETVLSTSRMSADDGRSNEHLRHIDAEMAKLAAALNVLEHEVDQKARSVQSHFTVELAELRTRLKRYETTVVDVRAVADDAAHDIKGVRQEIGKLAESLRRIERVLSRPASGGDSSGRPRIVQVGWEPDAADAAGVRSPDISAEAMAALPENVTVLLFASEPRDRPRPDLDKEIKEISKRIDEAEFGGRIRLRACTAAQAFDLLPNLNRHKPHMVQFSGHGEEGGLLLMGPRDECEPIAADQLMQMLRWANENLRIVFFNVCDSETHARLAAEFVDAAVGLRGELSDAPAREFAAQLYSALSFGVSVKRAFNQACAAIADWPDSAAPQLFFRDGGDPHKVVLVRP
jgi:hypothetical protein